MRLRPFPRYFVAAAALGGTLSIFGVAGAALDPAPVRAQAGGGAPSSTPGMHVDVSVAPAVALAAQKVVISGSTGYSEKQHQATIRVRHESGTPNVTLTAQVSPKGQFTATFSDTRKGGKYQVTVTAPDGKGTRSIAFRVETIASLAAAVEKLSGELHTRTKKLLKFLEDTAAAQPASPERDQLVARAQQLQQQASAMNVPPTQMLAELKKLVPGPNATPAPPPPSVQKLSEWVSEAEEGIEKIDEARIGEKPAPLCETINTAIEGAKFASYAFSITGKLLTTLVNIGVDKGIPVFVQSLGLTGADATATSHVLKTAAAGIQGMTSAVTAAITGITDYVEAGVTAVFNKYCGSFDGPLRVSMTMVWNEGSVPWLKYGVRLDGRLRLRFAKNAPAGKPIYLTGELEGNATNFTFWEDVTVAEPLSKGILVLERRWLAPIPFVNSTASPADFGMVARAATPSYFNVPVIGEMSGNTIKMQFKDARADFSPAVQNRLLFVVMTPLMPDFKVFTFPIQKAHWILSRGFSDPATLTVTKQGTVESVRMQGVKTHRETSNKGVVVDWVIDVDAKKSGG